MHRQNRQKGFSALEAILIVLLIAALAFGGWYFWQKNHNKPSPPNQQTAQPDEQPQQTLPDPYEGWKAYANESYGISFRYPEDWRVKEGAFDQPNSSATHQEYAITLERNVEEKYNATVNIEILNQNIQQTENWYYPNAPSGDVTKTKLPLKGKNSIQYVIKEPNEESRLYLFEVVNKTYLLESSNEWFNLSKDPDYWKKFDKVLDSLELK